MASDDEELRWALLLAARKYASAFLSDSDWSMRLNAEALESAALAYAATQPQKKRKGKVTR